MRCTALNMLYKPYLYQGYISENGKAAYCVYNIYMLNYSKHCLAQFVLTKPRNKMIKLVFPGM